MIVPLIFRLAKSDDRPTLRWVITKLQDYERLRHPTRLPGEQTADVYLDWILRPAEANSIVLVVERDSSFIGFVVGWIRQTNNFGETADFYRVGYISDICVIPAFRERQILAQLLDGIEHYFYRAGAMRLRISSLAFGMSTQASCERTEYRPYEVLYEKVIGDKGNR